jgi:DNA polymerase III alpha subunit (gram-positive type)
MSLNIKEQIIAALGTREHNKKDLLTVINYLKLNIVDADINNTTVINKIKETLNNKNILIIDTETTGLSVNNDRIIQVAYQLCNESGQLLEESNFYIKPDYPYLPIHDNAEKIHHITRDYATQNGISFHEFANKIKYILEKTDIIVAHNYNYDHDMIKSELKRLNRDDIILELVNKKSFCTLKNNPPRAKLGVLYKKLFNKNLDAALQHDALYDVIACKHIYFKNCNL